MGTGALHLKAALVKRRGSRAPGPFFGEPHTAYSHENQQGCNGAFEGRVLQFQRFH
jgi:hypothetical protein